MLSETKEEVHAWAVARAQADVDAAEGAERAASWCLRWERTSLSPRDHVVKEWHDKMMDARGRRSAALARLERVKAGDYRA